jgi:Helix-turn-helix domain
MKGEIDTSFETLQRDLFASGMAANIGMNAFGVWIAIKSHADYNTGECWPGMRRLSDLTGLSTGTVQKCIHTLVDARLLRIITEGAGKRSNRYVARERLDVKLGERVLCTIVIDYVPARLRQQLDSIESALKAGKGAPNTFAACEIIPGQGFEWDDKSEVLRAAIPYHEIPQTKIDPEAARLQSSLEKKVIALQEHARKPKAVDK